MQQPTVGRHPYLSVATMLTPAERLRVDAAGEGSYVTVHRDTVAEMIQDLKSNRVSAVLLSVSRCDRLARAGVATLVREFPRVPTIALLTQHDQSTPRAMLSLGSTGVAQLVDVREAKGWRELRNYLVASHGEDIKRLSLGQLAMDLSDVPADCWRFFEALFLPITQVRTVRALAHHLAVSPSTLMSRFFRARLPAPKQYLAIAQLIRAAQVLENSGLSIADAANQLDCSSPQAFGRHVKRLMNLTPVKFRLRYTGAGMLEYFRETLVFPYVEVLCAFHPISPPLVPSHDGHLIH